jgi:lytic murein transglycosylase
VRPGTSLAAIALAGALIFSGAPWASTQTQSTMFTPSGDAGFDSWRSDFAARAVASGRDAATVRRLLEGLTPEERVVTNDQNQPEFVRPVWDYVTRAVSADRVNRGRALRAEEAALFSAVEARFGVDADVIAGIWAIETNFGTAPLPHDAPRAIATLAYEGRRRAQFEGYLMALIDMVQRGYAGPEELKSSWAGALGQPQFMPDVYLRDAFDWDNDGHRDIWTNRGDVFASIANYLNSRGWSAGDPVFDEVTLPPGFDYGLADGQMRSIAEWEGFGVTRVGGAWSAASKGLRAQIFLPAGADGPALALFQNFVVIRSYNPSDRYAMAVALLARGFEGREGLRKPWPVQQGWLQKPQMMELQTALTQKGYTVGRIDGVFGANTRAALRAYQRAEGLPADGWATLEVLNRLTGRADAPAAPAVDPRHASSPALNAKGVRDLQGQLNRLGYKIGKPNGKVGPKTRAAIERLERRLGLPETGRASRFILAQAKALKK